MGAVYSSKMLVTKYQTIWRHIPEESNVHSYHHEDFKSHSLPSLHGKIKESISGVKASKRQII
jgi:hypothetical protein